MDMNFESYLIPIIAIGCLCIGFVLKKWMPADDKWIPTVLAIVGAILGVILADQHTANAIVTGAVAGAFSGLASVGLHQAFHQFIKIDTYGELTDEEAEQMMEREDEDGEEI